jgi:hypothetical protein
MRQALYFLLLFVTSFSASAQQTDENPNALINVNFFSVSTTNEPPIMWLSLPDSVKILADNKLLVLYEHYNFGISAILLEQQFLNSDFQIILPNNNTIFKAFAKRRKYTTLEPIGGLFERKKYLTEVGKEVEKITIHKPVRLAPNGEGYSISATLAKDEKILYLVNNKVVEESFIAKIDEEFMKKVFQMNADDSDLIAKFGERAKGFDNVFCIWTTDLINKK